MSVWVCVKLDSHKVNKKRNQTTLLSLQLPIPWSWPWPWSWPPPWFFSYPQSPQQDEYYAEFIVSRLWERKSVASCQMAVTSCQLPVANWQLLCFVNRLRHFCLPYVLRDDLLDKARGSDKQECCEWKGGKVARGLTNWRQVLSSKMLPCGLGRLSAVSGFLFICRTRHKLRPRVNVGAGDRVPPELWRSTLMSWLCFCIPSKFAGFCGLCFLPHLAASLGRRRRTVYTVQSVTPTLSLNKSHSWPALMCSLVVWGTKNRFVCFC